MLMRNRSHQRPLVGVCEEKSGAAERVLRSFTAVARTGVNSAELVQQHLARRCQVIDRQSAEKLDGVNKVHGRFGTLE